MAGTPAGSASARRCWVPSSRVEHRSVPFLRARHRFVPQRGTLVGFVPARRTPVPCLGRNPGGLCSPALEIGFRPHGWTTMSSSPVSRRSRDLRGGTLAGFMPTCRTSVSSLRGGTPAGRASVRRASDRGWNCGGFLPACRTPGSVPQGESSGFPRAGGIHAGSVAGVDGSPGGGEREKGRGVPRPCPRSGEGRRGLGGVRPPARPSSS